MTLKKPEVIYKVHKEFDNRVFDILNQCTLSVANNFFKIELNNKTISFSIPDLMKGNLDYKDKKDLLEELK